MGNFTTLIAEFKFTRRLTGNLMNVYIPSTLVVMLSWLSFWIDVHAAPARITLGVTSILTLVTHLVQSRSFVPPVDYLKALDVWFIFCIVLIFLSLLEYALAYNFVLKKRTDFHLILAIVAVWKDGRLNLKHLVSEYPIVFPTKKASKIWLPKFGYPNAKTMEKFYDSADIFNLKILPDESLFATVDREKDVILKWMGESNSPYKYLGKSIHIRNMNLLTYEMNEVKAKRVTDVWITEMKETKQLKDIRSIMFLSIPFI
ncbi:gamma-aminobutyric acid receptor subunit theta-like [Centruroides sculpturatus]|uniref:gamma-aminobutyric acid receptor subunit theta-like n=1 Tax=Centruroides sculpturatus TaxID=218467 RepID=UPI000C6CF5DE|nr:gamma-aminobutyric acid receptor subunit theta-like [Centruroides sculpturatus]